MQTTLFDTPNAISSPESADGRLLYVSPDGPTMSQSGPAPAPANLSPSPGRASAKTTRATSGLRFGNSSPSAALTSSLVSRLRERLDCDGSLEYKLTWRKIRTDWGLRSFALRASARKDGLLLLTRTAELNGRATMLLGRPTSGSGFSGWPTARSEDAESSGARIGRGVADTLTAVARLAGWVFPTATDGTRGNLPPRAHDTGVPLDQMAALAGWATLNVPNGGRSISHAEMKGATAYHDGKKVQIGLEAQARMAGWATPTSCDHFPAHSQEYVDDKKAQGHGMANLNDQAALLVSGPTSTSSIASTEKRGALNPRFSAWLMGYPEVWDELAMKIPKKSKRRS